MPDFLSFPHWRERTMRDAHNPAGGRMIIPPPNSSSHLSSSSVIPGSLHPAYHSPVKQHQSSLTFFFTSFTRAGGLEATKRGEISRWEEEGRERDTHRIKVREREGKKDDRLSYPVLGEVHRCVPRGQGHPPPSPYCAWAVRGGGMCMWGGRKVGRGPPPPSSSSSLSSKVPKTLHECIGNTKVFLQFENNSFTHIS